VSAWGSPVAGSITSVNLALSYYTPPDLADPTHQGLLVGHGITIPVFNCSEATNVSYPVFNANTLQINYVGYYPYSEQYYKLSLVQGVPYVLGSSASVDNTNWISYANNSQYHACVHVPGQLFGLTASYLGDADFGISPWNTDVTNDMQGTGGIQLTNGMKALGAAAYTSTADEYISNSTINNGGPLMVHSQDKGYPTDYMAYQRPLNPTAISTQGDGVRDGYTEYGSAAGTSPLALAVTIYSTQDTSCYTGYVPQDAVSVTVSGGSNGNALSSALTPLEWGQNGSTLGCNNQFNYHFRYTMPLNNSLPNFQVSFTLYHQLDANNDNKGTLTSPTLSLSTTTSWSTSDNCVSGPYTVPIVNHNDGSCYWVAVQVEPLLRAPVVFINNTGETTTLPGYGLRYSGEQQFYAFYLNINGTVSNKYPRNPFASGTSASNPDLNVLMISSSSYLATNFSTNLSAGTLASRLPHVFYCLGGATITTRAGGSSQLGLAGSLTTSMNDTCANMLLQQLIPRNATGNMTGVFQALNTTQIALLGLDTQTAELAMFLSLAGFNSGQGTENLQTIGGYLGGVLLSAVTFIYNGLVAIGNFMANLPAELEALGQVILGALSAISKAIMAAVDAALSILNFILKLIELAVQAAISLVTGALNSQIQSSVASISVPMLSYETNANPALLPKANYTAVTGQASPESNSTASQAISNDLELLLVTIGLIIAGVITVMLIAAALSGGLVPLALNLLSGLATKDTIQVIGDFIVGVIATVVLGITLLVLSNPSSAFSQMLKLPQSNVEVTAATTFSPFIADLVPFTFMKTVTKGPAPEISDVISLVGDIFALICMGIVAADPGLSYIQDVSLLGGGLFFAALSLASSTYKLISEGLNPQPVDIMATAANVLVAGADTGQLICASQNLKCT
jgi:hypothetical protein